MVISSYFNQTTIGLVASSRGMALERDRKPQDARSGRGRPQSMSGEQKALRIAINARLPSSRSNTPRCGLWALEFPNLEHPRPRHSRSAGTMEMNRTCKFLLVPVFLALLCFFLFVARHRFINLDEGFYLLASRLVLQHKAPYLDFFYTQAPLLPYAYGLWMKLFGISWFSARHFSAALTIILGLLVYEHVCRETQRWIAGLAAVVLFASSTYIFAWFPLAMTFSLASLFLFGAYVIASRLTSASPAWLVAVAGLLFGLSVDTRSYVVGLAPVFLWWIFRHSETRSRIARILWFLGGFTIGLGPSLCLFAASPDLFLFNNLGYHAIRSNSGLIGAWRGKLRVARTVLFGPGDNGFQFSLLSTVSFAGILVLRIRKGAALLAFLIALVLGVISILPTPPLVQYFCMCMPFLIVAAVSGASDYVASLRAGRPKQLAVLASIALLAAFVASSPPSFRRYLVTGRFVIGVGGPHDAQNWTLDRVSAVSKAIDQLAAPDEKIASFWPGYIFASKAEPYPGFENNSVGRMIANKLTVEQRAKYHILAESEIEADFAAHTPRIAVVGNQDIITHFTHSSEHATILLSDGYTAVKTIGDTSIFVCCSRP
jgi:dolichyl-phosphate-mannose-protein mannosyltransferase